jgi:hypothetical protein
MMTQFEFIGAQVAERRMPALTVVQANAARPMLPKLERCFIHGIHGSVVWSISMTLLSAAANESFDVTWARNRLHAACIYLPGCSTGQHVFRSGGPIGRRSN